MPCERISAQAGSPAGNKNLITIAAEPSVIGW
jgi:hypothetical protein